MQVNQVGRPSVHANTCPEAAEKFIL